MEESVSTLAVEIEALLLILVASGVYLLARRIRLPYTIALVLTGMGISMLGPINLREIFRFGLSSDLILLVFLPGLIFEAAYHLNVYQLRDNWKPILVLAVPGLLVSTGIIGVGVHLLLNMPLEVALLFGGLISATDPVSVLALFKELRVTRRLSIIMEGESLLNDGTAVVVFTILLGVALGEREFTLLNGITEFVVVTVGGLLVGVALGTACSFFFDHVEDHVIQIVLTIVLAYGTFVIAEQLNLSPVIAVVAAGVTLDTRQRGKGNAPPGAQISISDFWELVAFLINSAIFLLLGLEVQVFGEIEQGLSLMNQIGPILLVAGVVLLARLIVVGAAVWLSRYYDAQPIPPRWSVVIFWGGLRGSVSMALALSLPQDLAWRDTLLVLALGYVTFSLLSGGLTMKPLLRRLGLTSQSVAQQAWERLLSQIRMVASTRATFERLSNDHLLPPALDDTFRQISARTLDEQWAKIEALMLNSPQLMEERTRYILSEILRDRRAALLDLEQRGFINQTTYEQEVESLMSEIERIQESRSSEQVYASLARLIGPTDHSSTLQTLLREAPELAQSMGRLHLSQAASETIHSLIDEYPALGQFLSEDLEGFLDSFEGDAEQDMIDLVSEHPELQLQVARIALFELVSSQRAEFSRMLRLGLLGGQQFVELNDMLNEVMRVAEQTDQVRQVNALMLAITAMIRSLQAPDMDGDGIPDTSLPAEEQAAEASPQAATP